MTTRSVMCKGFALSGLWVAVLGAGLHAQVVNAHGHLADPPSRAALCHAKYQNQNVDCGQVQYEPWSIGEVVGSFPGAGPADGVIASGGVRLDFAALDEQSANRWHLTPIVDRNVQFAWHYEAPHPVKNWEYFITKADWNPNQKLTRASFDSTPFCRVEGHNQIPNPGTGTNPTHSCTLPADRSGQHVILAMWDVGDTDKTFHSVADVDIQLDGGPAPEWPRLAEISPNRDLEVGDKVIARAFDANGENQAFRVTITIDNAEEAIGANWAFKLAKRINETQTLVRAGKLDAEGNIEPVPGSNTIFAKVESGLTNYIVDIEAAVGDPATMHLHDVKPEYTLKDGKTTMDFSVMSNKALKVKAQLFDANNKQVGFAQQAVNGTAKFVLNVESVEGAHTLKVVGVDKGERVLLQEERTVELKAAGNVEYDFEYPQSISSYVAGTKVLQRKTGEVFECKPFPYSGWCSNPSAIHYEPGFGSNWSDAWNKL